MEGLGVQLRLLLLLISLWAPVPGSSLEGSCVAAGFTECCDLQVVGQCFAPPTYCICDPSCREHGDCCADIDLICPPDLLAPPVVLLAVELTFHTATLLWSISPETRDATNLTYSVIYWEYEEPHTSLSHNVSLDEGTGQTVRVTLTGLCPGILYQWRVEARTETTNSQSVVSNFSTVAAVELEGLSVQVYNTSSVVVSWAPPQLPFGVRLCNYTVQYAGTRASESVDDMLDSGRVVAWESSAVVTGLGSNLFYHFMVHAAVVEGEILTEDFLSSGRTTVFVPDSAIVQLRGGPFEQCRAWTEEIEAEALSVFRAILYQAVFSDTGHMGGDDRGRELIERDSVFCEDGSSDGSWAVYRASVYSSPNHTTETVISLLEQRVASGELLNLQMDKTCPLHLLRTSEPLCGPAHPPEPDKNCHKSGTATEPRANSLTSTNCTCERVCNDDQPVVTIPLLVTALVAELFLMVFVGLLVVTVVLVVRRRRNLQEEKSAQCNSAQPNEYS